MSAETDTYSTLSASAPLAAIVGTRIYPDVAPEADVGTISHPMAVFARSATDPTYTINGQLVAAEITMSINCYAGTRAVAEQIANIVVSAMAAASFYESDRSTDFNVDVNLYVSILDFRMWELPPSA